MMDKSDQTCRLHVTALALLCTHMHALPNSDDSVDAYTHMHATPCCHDSEAQKLRAAQMQSQDNCLPSVPAVTGGAV